MYLTRKHLSRRTVLKGAGATIALPLLDAMIPAGTALAQTAAAPARGWASSTSRTARCRTNGSRSRSAAISTFRSSSSRWSRCATT